MTLGIIFLAQGATVHANENELKRVRETVLVQSRTQGVVIFSAPWCPLCKAAKFHMKARGIVYIEHDVELGLDNMVRFHALGSGGLPLMLIRGEPLRGFSVDAFEDAFNPTPITEVADVTAPVAVKTVVRNRKKIRMCGR